MDNLDFSEEEIQQQLAILGYKNIPKHRLLEFKQDLDKLICHGQWKNLASTTPVNITSQTATSQSSPPAYTKEKVSLLYSKGSLEGFFLNEGKAFQDTEIRTQKNKASGWPQRHCGSYAERCVSARLQLPAAAPTRLQEEPDTDDALDSLLADSYTSLSDHQHRPFIKRKVLRKHEGKSLICDESVYTEDSDAASRLEERLAELDLSTSDQDYETESQDLTESDAQSSETDGVNLSAFESYIQRMTQTDRDVRPKPKSFIRPVMCQPTIKKTDPVAKYFQYKQMWDMFQVSGEKDRKALRWEIREKLAYQPLPPKPRRIYVPNTYIVPTEKKRSELRWMIRNDLANGLLPQKFNTHF